MPAARLVLGTTEAAAFGTAAPHGISHFMHLFPK